MFIRQGKKVQAACKSRNYFSLWNNTFDSSDDKSNKVLGVFHDNEPTFFTKMTRPEVVDHLKIQEQTLQLITNPQEFEKKLTRAKQNLAGWEKKKKSSPYCVEVLKGDWGDVTLKMTMQYAKEYAVLNMANAHFVGGGAFKGGSAQEEDMYARTSCFHWILEDPNASYVNEKLHAYMYTKEKSALINAKVMMDAKELEKLCQVYQEEINFAYKVHMDTEEPEICYKGPKIIVEVQLNNDNGASTQTVELSSKDGSYVDLPHDKIFPFHELRSAAVDLSQGYVVDDETGKEINVDWQDKNFVAWFEKESLRRIEAQLDTALSNGIKHIILSAFGCGEFKNDPAIVANLYKKAIEKRAEYFEHIVFAIYNSGRNARKNFSPFFSTLNGIKLGPEAKVENRPSFRMGGSRE